MCLAVLCWFAFIAIYCESINGTRISTNCLDPWNSNSILDILRNKSSINFRTVLVNSIDDYEFRQDIIDDVISVGCMPIGAYRLNSSRSLDIFGELTNNLIIGSLKLGTLICQHSQKALAENVWLIHCKNLNEIKLLTRNNLQHCKNIHINSQLYLWTDEFGNNLQEVYRKSTISELIIGRVSKKSKKIWDRRKSLTGVNIAISYMDDPLWEMPAREDSKVALEGNDDQGNLIRQEGVTTDMHWLLQQQLNFTTVFKRASEYGIFDAHTGEATGIVKMVADSSVVLGSLLTPTPGRIRVVTIIPVISDQYGIFSRIRDSKGGDYTKVFSKNYWAVLVLSGFFMSWLLVLFSLVFYRDDSPKHLPWISSVSLPLRAAIAIDIQPSMDPGMARLISYRMAIFWTVLLGSYNYYCFNGALISHLTVQEKEVVETFSDLDKGADHKLFIMKGHGIEDILRNGGRKVWKRTWENFMDNGASGILKTIWEIESKVLESENNYGCALMTDVMFQVKDYPCKIRTSSKPTLNTHIGLAMPYESPYLPLISYHVNAFLESGTWNRLYRIRVTNASHSCITDDDQSVDNDGFEFIDWTTTFPTFQYLFFGIGISVCVAVIEFLINY